MIKFSRHFFEGVELFNSEEFYECHEVLEDVWNAQVDPEKQLTQGIIQLAVGLYHSRRNNFVGAVKLIKRALERIDKSMQLAVPLDLTKLREDARQSLEAVEAQRVPDQFLIIVRDLQ